MKICNYEKKLTPVFFNSFIFHKVQKDYNDQKKKGVFLYVIIYQMLLDSHKNVIMFLTQKKQKKISWKKWKWERMMRGWVVVVI